MRTFFMLMRREVWEHPAFFIAPLVVVAVFSLVISADVLVLEAEIFGPTQLVAALSLIDETVRPTAYRILGFISLIVFNIVLVFVVGFYLMDCLYAERKDRSILFWKSLPVSDTTTVGSKIATAMFTVPGATLAVFFVSWIFFAFLFTIFVWIGGGSAWDLIWKPLPVVDVVGFAAYVLVVQSFIFLPFIGWVALASAWARRMPFLWVILVPLVITLAETFVFRTNNFISLIGERFSALLPLAFTDEKLHEYNIDLDELRFEQPVTFWELVNPTPMLTSPQLWGGIAVGIVLIAASIWLRRYRDES